TGGNIDFSKSRDGGYLMLKIGDPNFTLTGKKTYCIRYNYGIGDDGIKQFDDLYYNLIGNGWDTTISKVTFHITMPKAFDKSLLSFTAGAEGSTDGSIVKSSVSGNTITGKVTSTLQPYEGVTVRLELPQGYFVAAKKSSGIGFILFDILLAALSLLLYLMFGRDARVYIPVEVTPPEEITSAEAGYIIDGHVDTRDVVSLIIYWADKGYLTISDDGKGNFILNKTHGADEAMRPYEKDMFAELFKGRNSVTADDLKYTFYQTIQQVKQRLAGSYKSDPAKRIYTASGNVSKAWCYVMAGLCAGVALFSAAGSYFFSLSASAIAGAVGFAVTASIAAIVGYAVDKSASGAKSTAGAIFASLLYSLALLIMAAVAFYMSGLAAPAIAGALAAAVCGIAGSFAKKRTQQGGTWLGRLLGLKRFIELADKSRIEKLVEENPSAFYNILPFAFALGVTDKWAKQFEKIAIAPPSWYYGYQGNAFNTIIFASMLNRNMYAYQANMVSTPPKSSGGGGGFGGGGFSGGGFGGGGGGSW
ncbi:MAG: DUF2207 domain-containing protein, partial [Clostridia bacterium]|nr:DUF2207 domain-containing protein [Clostridia bacterium]